jgi:hypothetical protein
LLISTILITCREGDAPPRRYHGLLRWCWRLELPPSTAAAAISLAPSLFICWTLWRHAWRGARWHACVCTTWTRARTEGERRACERAAAQVVQAATVRVPAQAFALPPAETALARTAHGEPCHAPAGRRPRPHAAPFYAASFTVLWTNIILSCFHICTCYCWILI